MSTVKKIRAAFLTVLLIACAALGVAAWRKVHSIPRYVCHTQPRHYQLNGVDRWETDYYAQYEPCPPKPIP